MEISIDFRQKDGKIYFKHLMHTKNTVEPVATYSALDWHTGWNPSVGLWTSAGPGHTRSVADKSVVHAGPDATMRLLVAAETDTLNKIDLPAVLSAIRRTQLLEPGRNFGRFYWYAEETQLADDHAVFFNGMSLIAFWHLYRKRLDTAGRDMLANLLRDLQVYAEQRAWAKGYHYPNEYLGYLICAWLPAELLGQEETCKRLEPLMREAADYWRKYHWGWGEHLSDIYADIILDEISLLLLMSRQLSPELRERYRHLLIELMRIEDLYDGGPRVPAIRSYAFTVSPTGSNYRKRVQPVPLDATFQPSPSQGQRLLLCQTPFLTASGKIWKPLGHILHKLNWHELAPKRLPRRRNVIIPCITGIQATARIEADIRLGSVSRFPLMPSAEHPIWGLSWQCFPVALWHKDGKWGFFQWETLESGRRRSHPAEDKHKSGLGNALTLAVRPPIVGRTHVIQHGGRLLALRVMPAVTAVWEELCDRFRLIGDQTGMQCMQTGERSWQLLLSFPERMVSVQCMILTGVEPVLVKRSESILDWEVRLDSGQLQNRRRLVTLWGISLDGAVNAPPEIEPDPEAPHVPRSAEERAWRLRWRWPAQDWNVCIDPLADDSLQENKDAGFPLK